MIRKGGRRAVIGAAAAIAIAAFVILGPIRGTAAGDEGFPTRDDVEPVFVEEPKTNSENGIITEEEWAEFFPEIVASYQANSENSYTIDYLKEDTYLTNIYEDYGFAIEYNGARGHEYCLEDVQAIARPHPLANCLTCKTADFTALVMKLGEDEAYKLDFEETAANMVANVGCFNCHGNAAGNDGQLMLTHDYQIRNLWDLTDEIKPQTLVCGQCHIEYYFKPENKATNSPYGGTLESMSPEAILAYYDEIDFADWTQKSTGAKLLKAQHPEFETFLGEGGMHAPLGLTCADCHMAVEKAENGTVYISHKLESPLDNPALLQTCTACHGDTDMAEKVHGVQAAVTARETTTGFALSDFKDKLAEAVSSGKYTEEELDAIRKVYRDAQWYFDFCYVENSEGAHNSYLANDCLDRADELIEQGNGMFK